MNTGFAIFIFFAWLSIFAAIYAIGSQLADIIKLLQSIQGGAG